jgi:hypothetical protein
MGTTLARPSWDEAARRTMKKNAPAISFGMIDNLTPFAGFPSRKTRLRGDHAQPNNGTEIHIPAAPSAPEACMKLVL